ncbi:hypothetical protein HPB51_014656 [Rhipicephalus microplus]|uniref:Uncharacterized protein n=1 Tax=Rhipicephalus microplus TaxID=6941 RepID=A0A9J6F4F9_RHIMP|nr:hypothetical protein HPB51_014656 [Rhipicephalus microplus]
MPRLGSTARDWPSWPFDEGAVPHCTPPTFLKRPCGRRDRDRRARKAAGERALRIRPISRAPSVSGAPSSRAVFSLVGRCQRRARRSASARGVLQPVRSPVTRTVGGFFVGCQAPVFVPGDLPLQGVSVRPLPATSAAGTTLLPGSSSPLCNGVERLNARLNKSCLPTLCARAGVIVSLRSGDTTDESDGGGRAVEATTMCEYFCLIRRFAAEFIRPRSDPSRLVADSSRRVELSWLPGSVAAAPSSCNVVSSSAEGTPAELGGGGVPTHAPQVGNRAGSRCAPRASTHAVPLTIAALSPFGLPRMVVGDEDAGELTQPGTFRRARPGRSASPPTLPAVRSNESLC